MGEKRQENNPQVAKWHGIDRKTIDWSPTVDEDKCIGCGICFVGCGKKVYDFDFKKNKTVVARPLNCMVGCTTCQVTCLADAISFPDKGYVRKIIKDNAILANVKKELKKE